MPSGLVLSLQEVRVEDVAGVGRIARFRYVSAALDGMGFAAVEEDFPVLCTAQVLPWVAGQPEVPVRVVISLAAAPVDFGTSAPEVTQYFEVFRLEDAACIWEGL
ncbi:DUF6497 family protein [Pseudooceanicola sp. LIPI14-2-Ac024]|uniref:DUF6497 family protein n=1 Tax=Pseudooceanicola sp. LIPI14-2-Ac024 TaxID=3344875 RepID=UPI0035D03D18